MVDSKNSDKSGEKEVSNNRNTDPNRNASQNDSNAAEEESQTNITTNTEQNHVSNSSSDQTNRQIMVYNPIIPDERDNPNCPICLTRVNDRAYTDRCLHEFCRPCIEQWSQNHNRCPVCREMYSRILYNIRNRNDYDEQAVSAPQTHNMGLLITDGHFGILATPQDTGIYLINPISTPHGINYSLLFMAPNQLFILNNMNPEMILTRPEGLENALTNLEETNRQTRHGTHPNFMRRHNHHNGFI